MFKKPSVLYAVIAAAALSVGLLDYLLGRQPEHVYFLFHGFSLVHGHHSLFGVLGNYLPSFVHVYAFILLTAAVAGFSKTRLIRICATWFAIAFLFEVAQHPALSPIIAVAVPAWFMGIPILDNTAAYFLNGTFDILDLLSIALGTIAAYFTVGLTRNRADTRSLSKLSHRVWRNLALGGITLFGMLTIIGSGGGSSAPDTTPPTVSTTYPANAATGVFVDGSIRITFSERMDPATVNPSTFTLEDNVNHAPVLATVDYGGDTVTFTPTNPLLPSLAYTATITTAAKDLAGNALAADHSWSFTTETDAWSATSTTGAPTGRAKPTAVWTGSKMIVWGGQGNSGVTNTGGLYDPSTPDSWLLTTITNAPTPRSDHTAVWTGSKMIVWGGQGNSGVTNTGGLYDPALDTWSPTTTSGAPVARIEHTAVWTGTKMIVWGGDTVSTGLTNSGGQYDPSTPDNWLPMTAINAPTPRLGHTAVWTGTKMIVWGGWDGLSYLSNGAAYDPVGNSWQAIAAPPAGFFGRAYHTAVWTGTEMIIWGGFTNNGVTDTGAAYNPVTDSWRLISTSGAPTPRLNHTAVWTGPTGISMVVWGGQDGMSTLLSDGGRYDPVTDSWKTTDLTNNLPTGRFDHTAVWTGSEMIVWGGFTNTGVTNTGGRYTP